MSIVRPTITGRSREIATAETVKSVRTAGNPIAAKELNMLEPMIFPITSSGSLLRAPAIAATNTTIPIEVRIKACAVDTSRGIS